GGEKGGRVGGRAKTLPESIGPTPRRWIGRCSRRLWLSSRRGSPTPGAASAMRRASASEISARRWRTGAVPWLRRGSAGRAAGGIRGGMGLLAHRQRPRSLPRREAKIQQGVAASDPWTGPGLDADVIAAQVGPIDVAVAGGEAAGEWCGDINPQAGLLQ